MSDFFEDNARTVLWAPYDWALDTVTTARSEVGDLIVELTKATPFAWSKSFVGPVDHKGLDGRNKCVTWSFENARDAVLFFRTSGPGVSNTFAVIIGQHTALLAAYPIGVRMQTVLPRDRGVDLGASISISVTTFENCIHLQFHQGGRCAHLHTFCHPGITETSGEKNGIGSNRMGALTRVTGVKAHTVKRLTHIILVMDTETSALELDTALQYYLAQIQQKSFTRTIVTPVVIEGQNGRQFKGLEGALEKIRQYYIKGAYNIAMVLFAHGIGQGVASSGDYGDGANVFDDLNSAISSFSQAGVEVWGLAPPIVNPNDALRNELMIDFAVTSQNKSNARVNLDLATVFMEDGGGSFKTDCFDGAGGVSEKGRKTLIATIVKKLTKEMSIFETPQARTNKGGSTSTESQSAPYVSIQNGAHETWKLAVDPSSKDFLFVYNDVIACRIEAESL